MRRTTDLTAHLVASRPEPEAPAAQPTVSVHEAGPVKKLSIDLVLSISQSESTKAAWEVDERVEPFAQTANCGDQGSNDHEEARAT